MGQEQRSDQGRDKTVVIESSRAPDGEQLGTAGRASTGSLAKRAVDAGVWTFIFRSAGRGLGFIRNVALARILAPDDLGLFGIVLLVLAFVERFTETGIHAALVQRKHDIRNYLDNAWTVLVIRRVALAVAVALLAPMLAAFFSEPRATPLLQLLALSMFVHAFDNIGIVQYQRELNTKKQFIHSLSGNAADLVVSVVLSIVLRSPWALMLGLLANRVVSVAVSYLVHSYRPKPRLNLSQTRELGRFGRWVFGVNVLGFLAYRGDNLVVGKMLGSAALGVYTLGFAISEVVTLEIARIINLVAFPAYARQQADRDRLRTAFLVVTELIVAASVPVAVLVSMLAEPLTLAILGRKWIEVADLLPPLALAGCVRAIVGNGSVVSKALGRPDHGFRRTVVQIVIMYAAMSALLPAFGIVGVGYAVLLGTVAAVPVFVRDTTRLLGIDGSAIARVLLPGVVLSIGVALSLFLTDLLPLREVLPELLVRGGTALLVAGVLSVLLWRYSRSGPLRIMEILRVRRSPSPAQSAPNPGCATATI